ncbi:serine/threonine protein kinase [Nostoc parmelioides]|uniref:Serine/threonine protein kinase n=1 Tax=Nostoc parmelioides FACHB-3921 TaxID=2692909 RepID=A0ABR8B7W2_9NOSO|nr:serine/threonine protein kinase [Nostoc parmelioides]MBD2249885.1 serine/threonine protein kinase [Nostoc parmelioides FACHB-3921]
MNKSLPTHFQESIYQELLPSLQIESVNPRNLIQVNYVPQPWLLLGKGNYAAVVYHPNYPEFVVKIYAPKRPGYEEEVEVYHRLGSHPAFSECLYAQDGFLVLKRLYGTTLYDCMHLGLPIPKQVIRDIDDALEYAQSRGLYPHDVHGRNVIMHEGRGLVVDISDFLHQEPCSKWKNLKKAYYWLYLPVLRPLRLRVPYSALDWIRKCYRLGTSCKQLCSQLASKLNCFKYFRRSRKSF